MTITVDLDLGDTKLSHLVERAVAGDDVIIASEGRPVARLIAVEATDKKPPKRRLGLLVGRGTVPDDFDDPLPDDIIAAFEGR